MNTLSLSLNTSEQRRLTDHLNSTGFDLHTVQHAQIAGKKPGLNVVLYHSGKLVVQGKETAAWREFVLEPDILQRLLDVPASAASSPKSAAGSSPDSPHDPSHAPSQDLRTPRIGIDESGKGDFFGPMVIAGFYLHPNDQPLMQELGVRDSKQISSDDKMIRVADILQKRLASHVEILVLKPETYNSLVARMGSVNRVLAWGHATVLETLLTRHPSIELAVADQFGPEHQIQQALKTRGKGIRLVQRHRAESDPAVAAASILARAAFVQHLRSLGETVGVTLPKGATHVRPTGEALVRDQGPEVLKTVAKTHFKTTRQVLSACGHAPDLLGTPEPKQWSKFKR